MQFIYQSDTVATKWSGGETQQLFIYPAEATLTNRDFDLRISTAIVNQEESDFTTFPGYQRFIFSLNNPLQLFHEIENGIFEQQLEPYDLGVFSGDWTTRSVGKVRDFNIIFKSPLEPKVRVVDFADNLQITCATSHLVMTVLEGKVMVNNTSNLEEFESVVLYSEDLSAHLKADKAKIVLIEF